ILPALAEQFSTLRSGVHTIRSYYLVEDAGKMINPADESRNVAFRVDTLLHFVDTLLKSANPKPDIVAEALTHAGYAAAKDFSEYLRSQWSGGLDPQAVQLTPPSKLQKWCDF